jgi:hypothetical protein
MLFIKNILLYKYPNNNLIIFIKLNMITINVNLF